MDTKELSVKELFDELLEKNTIEERLKNNKAYQNNLVKLNFGFYLLKRYMPQNHVKTLFLYDELSEDIHLTEKYEIFKEGMRQAGF